MYLQTQQKKLWKPEEDEILREVVLQLNNDKWIEISQQYQERFLNKHQYKSSRTAKQCRQRWYNNLDPSLALSTKEWSKDEDSALIHLFSSFGSKWTKIAGSLQEQGFGKRGDNSIKNHFHILLKRLSKDLSVFVEDWNSKVKQNEAYRKSKKKYKYDRVYSIEKIIRRQQTDPKDEKNAETVSQTNTLLKTQSSPMEPERKDHQSQVLCVSKQFLDYNSKCQSLGCCQKDKIEEQVEKKPSLFKKIQKKHLDKFLLTFQEAGEDVSNSLNAYQLDIVQKTKTRLIELIANFKAYAPQKKEQFINLLGKCGKYYKKMTKRVPKKTQKRSKNFSHIIQKGVKNLLRSFLEHSSLDGQQRKIMKRKKQQISSRLKQILSKVVEKKQLLFKQVDDEFLLDCKQKEEIIETVIQEVRSQTRVIPKQTPLSSEFIGIDQGANNNQCSPKQISKEENKRSRIGKAKRIQKIPNKEKSRFTTEKKSKNCCDSRLGKNIINTKDENSGGKEVVNIKVESGLPKGKQGQISEQNQKLIPAVSKKAERQNIQIFGNFNFQDKNQENGKLAKSPQEGQDELKSNFSFRKRCQEQSLRQKRHTQDQEGKRRHYQNINDHCFRDNLFMFQKPNDDQFPSQSFSNVFSNFNENHNSNVRGNQRTNFIIERSLGSFDEVSNHSNEKRKPQQEKINSFKGNNFLENIRSIEEKNPLNLSRPQILNFEGKNCHDQEKLFFSVAEEAEFEVPQKLIDSAQNPGFPRRNLHDYSHNYQHQRSLEISKMMDFNQNFGFNSARLSEISIFKESSKQQSKRSKEKDNLSGSGLFQSQKIPSMSGSFQFIKTSRPLSNSCRYENSNQLFQDQNLKEGKEIKCQTVKTDKVQKKEGVLSQEPQLKDFQFIFK